LPWNVKNLDAALAIRVTKLLLHIVEFIVVNSVPVPVQLSKVEQQIKKEQINIEGIVVAVPVLSHLEQGHEL